MTRSSEFGRKLALLLSSSLTMMAGATIAAALPSIEANYADEPHAGLLTRLVLTLPALGIVVFSPLAGWIADRHGRTRLLTGSLLLYAVSGMAGIWIEDLVLLLVSRFLLGASVAGSMTTTVTLIGDYYSGQQRASFLGTQSAFMGFGGVVFVAAGGWLAGFSWHAPFALYGLSLLVLPLAWWFLNEPDVVDEGSRGAPEGTTPPPTGSSSPGSIILTVYATIFGMMVVFYATPTQAPFYLTTEFARNSTWIGLAISALTLGGALGSLAYGRVKRHLSYTTVYQIIFAGSGLGYLAFGFAPTFELAAAALFLTGLGLGMLMPNSSVCLLDNAPARQRGRVMGGMTTAVFLGQFMSPLLTQPMLAAMSPRHVFESLGALLLGVALVTATVFFIRGRLRPASV